MGNWSLRVIPILILIAITIAIAALIFVIVVILNPHWEWFKNFPYMRESVTALSTAAMVVATLFLAYATFSIISSDRQRSINESHNQALIRIRDWAEYTFGLIIEGAEVTKGYEDISDVFEEFNWKLQYGKMKFIGVGGDARRLGGKISSSVFQADLVLGLFCARLINHKEELEKFRQALNIKDKILPFTSLDELIEGTGEVYAALSSVNEEVTNRLVPLYPYKHKP